MADDAMITDVELDITRSVVGAAVHVLHEAIGVNTPCALIGIIHAARSYLFTMDKEATIELFRLLAFPGEDMTPLEQTIGQAAMNEVTARLSDNGTAYLEALDDGKKH